MTDQFGNIHSLEKMKGKPIYLLFLRYAGCPVCSMTMKAINQEYESMKDRVQILVLLQSTPGIVMKFTEKHQITYPIIADKDTHFYTLFEVPGGSLGQYLKPTNLASALKATFKGNMHGKFEGQEYQMPAEFVVDGKGHFRYVHYASSMEDILSIDQLLNLL